jgi:hypothetical protein
MTTAKRNNETGLSLIEVMIAMIIFVGAGAPLLAGLATSASVRVDCTDRYVAIEAVLGIADEIRGTPIGTVASVWGPEGSRGNTFSIQGLDGSDGIPAGSVTIVTDETTTDANLGIALGMPRDLDGDGLPENVDVSSNAVALPVIIEASWGPEGKRESFKIPVVLVR